MRALLAWALIFAGAHWTARVAAPSPGQLVLDSSDGNVIQRYGRTISEPNSELMDLTTNWTVLGPFPAGMRELPFGGFPPSVAGSYGSLYTESLNNLFPSTYGTINGSTTSKSVTATAQGEVKDTGVQRVKQDLIVDYPEIDWAFIRKTAGWDSLQWQMMAVTDLEITGSNQCSSGTTIQPCTDHISQNSSVLVSFTTDKVAEFAIVPRDAFDQMPKDYPIEWYNGDWYSYVRSATNGADGGSPRLSTAQHKVTLQPGSYRVLLRSMYEIRIFADPGQQDPKLRLGIDIQATQATIDEEIGALQPSLSSLYSNTPDIVGGWFAGWGLSLGVENLDSENWYRVLNVKAVGPASDALDVKLERPKRFAPLQTRSLPIKAVQRAQLEDRINSVIVEVTYTAARSDKEATEKHKFQVEVPLRRKDPFYAKESPNNDLSFIFTYLDRDDTLQVAVAIPPKRPTFTTPRPPLILALHGAGVNVRDLGFAGNFNRQEQSWMIQPTGRTPWGYDWQLASMSTADEAIKSFGSNMWGLPPSCPSDSENEALRKDAVCMKPAERDGWTTDTEKLFIVGHSNGGQGSWYRLSRFPDRAIGGVVASAYIKVADYVPFEWKRGRHFNDPSLTGILRSSLSMFENDLHASNLAGLPLLVKHGANDTNVPPWNSRDMVSIVETWNQLSGIPGLAQISEVPGKGHWWDTLMKERDVDEAIAAKCTEDRNPGFTMPDFPERFTLTVANPSEAGSKGGWSIREIETPGRLSKLSVELKDGAICVKTTNAHRVRMNSNRWKSDVAQNISRVRLDHRHSFELSSLASNDNDIEFIKSENGVWRLYEDQSSVAPSSSRPPRPIGPMLRIVSSNGPINLVIPRYAAASDIDSFQSIARRFSDDSLLYGGLDCNIMFDTEALDALDAGEANSSAESFGNFVVLGGPNINQLAKRIVDTWPGKQPISFTSSSEFQIRDRHFWESSIGLLMLAPHPLVPETGLSLILHGTDTSGFERAARALPVRTATMIPEWVVIDDSAEWAGEGGVKGAGWYDSHWQWSESMSYLV